MSTCPVLLQQDCTLSWEVDIPVFDGTEEQYVDSRTYHLLRGAVVGETPHPDDDLTSPGEEGLSLIVVT